VPRLPRPTLFPYTTLFRSRIIFKDFETSNWAWDPVAKAYYWHRFYSHQPDLNFDNPAVLEALEKVCDFWLGLGVDGLRLDAIPRSEEHTSELQSLRHLVCR